MLASVTRITVTLTVILFETTGRWDLLPVLMGVVLCSKNLADCFNISLYDMHVELKCIPFVDHEPPEAEEDAKHSNGNLDMRRFRQSRAQYNPIHGDGEGDDGERQAMSVNGDRGVDTGAYCTATDMMARGTIWPRLPSPRVGSPPLSFDTSFGRDIGERAAAEYAHDESYVEV